VAARFQIRFDPAEIPALAARFRTGESDAALERDVAAAARAQGYLTRPQLLRVCEWKSPRSRPRCQRNDAALVEETTRLALGAASERLRIGLLLLLDGVAYPTASVILHFCHRDRYPILDVRALWSVGAEAGQREGGYSFDFWQAYVDYTRELAERQGVTMRVLDRALWQFSLERQPSLGEPAAAPPERGPVA
jgi:hypothetical protein